MVWLVSLFYICSYMQEGQMERKHQLSNVAFGGDWTEAIVPLEQLTLDLNCLHKAVEDAEDSDPLAPDVVAALERLTGVIARGDMQRAAFMRAGRIEDPYTRTEALQRTYGAIISGTCS